MKKITCVVLVLFLINCTKNNSEIHNSGFPKLVDTLATATLYFSPNSIQLGGSYINKVQKFGEVVDLRDTIVPYQYFIDYHSMSDTINKNVTKRDGLEVIIDTTSEITIKQFESDFDLFSKYMLKEKSSKKEKFIDSVSYQAVQKFINKNPKLFKGMSVFVTNPGTESVRVEVQDWQLMMIQEAMDKSGKWKPIEYWEFSGCGNSYGGIALKPNHLIATKIIKYSGNFKTKLRLKFLNDSIVYYSKPFTGSINSSQFDTIPVDHQLDKRNFLEPRKPRKKLRKIQ
ncbi:hypothetical protein [Flavobacterium flavigenum]|uniref:hypothetical protein n=1 Tax=Flavobacterium flavigenum TaxID=3003258 RepID=UPI0022AC5218|nr:hypothetical protein [Flavobacterium flavigenum]